MTLAVMSAFGICPPHMLININKKPSAEQHMAQSLSPPLSVTVSVCSVLDLSQQVFVFMFCRDTRVVLVVIKSST